MQAKNFFIADSGGTKTEWAFVNNGKHVATFTTVGLDPKILTTDEVYQILKDSFLPQLAVDSLKPEKIFFYGTGCSIASNQKLITDALQRAFPQTKIDVQHDMLGAARGVCLNKKGIATILGTGSSTAVYDGKFIEKSRVGIGYILGDEGSGAYMGKKFINLYIYAELPKAIEEKFEASFKLDKDSIIEKVYKGDAPNRFMASFARFVYENKEVPQIADIITEGFESFFVRHLLKFEEAKSTPLNFVGGIAGIFSDEITAIAKKYNLSVGKFMRAPMPGLIQYHCEFDK